MKKKTRRKNWERKNIEKFGAAHARHWCMHSTFNCWRKIFLFPSLFRCSGGLSTNRFWFESKLSGVVWPVCVCVCARTSVRMQTLRNVKQQPAGIAQDLADARHYCYRRRRDLATQKIIVFLVFISFVWTILALFSDSLFLISFARRTLTHGTTSQLKANWKIQILFKL